MMNLRLLIYILYHYCSIPCVTCTCARLLICLTSSVSVYTAPDLPFHDAFLPWWLCQFAVLPNSSYIRTRSLFVVGCQLPSLKTRSNSHTQWRPSPLIIREQYFFKIENHAAGKASSAARTELLPCMRECYMDHGRRVLKSYHS